MAESISVHIGQFLFNYRVAALCVLDNKILIHKSTEDDFWCLPGGRVHAGEDSHMALKREFLEELGQSVKIERTAWINENFFEYTGKNFHEISIAFWVSFESEMKPHAEEFPGIEENNKLVFRWIDISDIDKIKIYPEFLQDKLAEMMRDKTIIHRITNEIA